MRDEAQALLAANHAFYAAFAEGDADRMEALWAESVNVACIHPGAGALHGRSLVMQTWQTILEGGGAPGIHCDDGKAVVLGDAGFVTCIERIGDAELIATNVFVREDGRWRMVHHQAGAFR